MCNANVAHVLQAGSYTCILCSTLFFSAIVASCLVVDGGDSDQKCSFSSSLFVDVEAIDKEGHGSSW